MNQLKYLFIIVLSVFIFVAAKSNSSNFYSKIKVLSQVFKLVEHNYVDDVNMDTLVEGSIRGLLETLDPHSNYITVDEFKKIEEIFDQEFEGIGIEFSILGGFITVISPIPGTPSERAGLVGGDQFVKINDQSAYKITQEEVFKKLRGPKGSKVVVTVSRMGVDDFDITLVRDKIPITSVLASFLYSRNVGYIKVNRFAKKTFDEIVVSIDSLQSLGMENLVLDLRNNGGGLMDQALQLLDLFINSNDTLLYTRGRIENSNNVFYATKNILDKNFPIIVLINRSSASASEIIAGTMQDLDRGFVVGETSFGKGLVQRQYSLNDGSAARITIAKYYTPSGRQIQRSFGDGLYEYYNDLNNNNRELSDSLIANKPQFKTQKGRTVFGGGGITPDIYIRNQYLAEDTKKLIFHPKRIVFQYANSIKTNYDNYSFSQYLNLAQKNKLALSKELSYKQFNDWCQEAYQPEINELNQDSIILNWAYIANVISSEIAKNLWGKNAFYHLSLMQDNQFHAALNNISLAKKILK